MSCSRSARNLSVLFTLGQTIHKRGNSLLFVVPSRAFSVVTGGSHLDWSRLDQQSGSVLRILFTQWLMCSRCVHATETSPPGVRLQTQTPDPGSADFSLQTSHSRLQTPDPDSADSRLLDSADSRPRLCRLQTPDSGLFRLQTPD